MVDQLREVLGTHPGTTEVRLRLMTRTSTTVMRLDDRLRVAASPDALRRPQGAARPALPDQRMSGRRDGVLADVVVVLGCFAVAGLVAGLLWPQLVSPVEVVRTEAGLTTAEVALSERFDNDAWFMVLAVALGAPARARC